MNRYPALNALFFFCCGIALSAAIFSVSSAASLFFLCALLAAAAACRGANAVRIKKAFSPLLFSFAGASLFIVQASLSVREAAAIRNRTSQGKAALEGTLLSLEETDGRQRGLFRVEKIRDGLADFRPFTVLVSFRKGLKINLQEEEAACLSGKLRLFDARDAQSYPLLSSGIKGVLSVRKASDAKGYGFREKKSFWRKLLLSARDKLSSTLGLGLAPGREKDIYLALVLGERKRLAPETALIFQKTGTFHIFALSGLHFATVVFSAAALLSLFGLDEKKRFLPVALFAAFYLVLTGLRISSLRACVMIILMFASRRLCRDYKTLNALGVCGTAFLAFNPFSLFTPGFQLSFAAVLGIATLNKWLRKKMSDRLSSPLDKLEKRSPAASLAQSVAQAGILCFSTWVFTSAALMFHFKEFSLTASLCNLLVLPLVSLVIQFGAASCFAGLILPVCSQLLNTAAESLLKGICAIITLFYRFFNPMIQTDRPGAAVIGLALAGFVLFFLFDEDKKTRDALNS